MRELDWDPPPRGDWGLTGPKCQTKNPVNETITKTQPRQVHSEKDMLIFEVYTPTYIIAVAENSLGARNLPTTRRLRLARHHIEAIIEDCFQAKDLRLFIILHRFVQN